MREWAGDPLSTHYVLGSALGPHPFPSIVAEFEFDWGLGSRGAVVLGFEEAIHKMTAMPAGRMGLADRGVLAVGMIADINIFHADTVTDFDDWSHPHRYAAGFEYVLVNGTVMVRDSKAVDGVFPGKPVHGTGKVA